MGFCSGKEYELFLKTVSQFEELLTHCGIILIKYYLDISKKEQEQRLEKRKDDFASEVAAALEK